MEANGASDIDFAFPGGGLIIPGVSLEMATSAPDLFNEKTLNGESNANLIIENAELIYFIPNPQFGT